MKGENYGRNYEVLVMDWYYWLLWLLVPVAFVVGVWVGVSAAILKYSFGRKPEE